MNKTVSNRIALIGLSSMMILVGGAATLVTRDWLWIVLGGAVCAACLVAILFLPTEDDDDRAMAQLVTGDMSDPRQRWPMIRSTVLSVPHAAAYVLLIAQMLTRDDDRPFTLPGTLGSSGLLFGVMVVTGAFIVFDLSRVARRDAYLSGLYAAGLAKTGGLFMAVALTWQLAHETFGIYPPQFVYLYGIASVGFCLFFYGDKAFRGEGA